MRFLITLAVWSVAPWAMACSLCTSLVKMPTFSEEMDNATLVVVGTLSNPKLNPNSAFGAGGTTDLTIESIIKNDGSATVGKTITLTRYLPVPDPKQPPRYLIFFDKFRGQLEPLQGVFVKSALVEQYIQDALKAKSQGRLAALVFYGKNLDHSDETIARDAFVEFAKSKDTEVAAAAKKLDPATLRQYLARPNLEPERLSLAAFLLGCCGNDGDVDRLQKIVKELDRERRSAIDGCLAAYATLRPAPGWKEITRVMCDKKQPFDVRFAAIRAARMMQGWKGDAVKSEILTAYRGVIPDGETADFAIEDLRRWKWWDLTPDIAAQFGQPTHRAPIVQHCMIRYALSCPRPDAKGLVARARQIEPDWVEYEEKLIAESSGR